MALRLKVENYIIRRRDEIISSSLMYHHHHHLVRYFRSNVDWKKLRPMIVKRINERAKSYPLKWMTPVAHDVLDARKLLITGVSTLLAAIPVKACKFCPEVYIGGSGHRIKTCHGFKRIKRDKEHRWVNATIDDIITRTEVFHLRTMFQPVIKHEERFDFDRISAVLELCSQAGADISKASLHNENQISSKIEGIGRHLDYAGQLQMVDDKLDGFDGELDKIGQWTLDTWERLRVGVQKLLLVYPAKVCEHCSEIHIGPSGHKARVCGVFKFEGWRGALKWKKAEVDDLVPLKVVWHQRPHDPKVLVHGGQGYYGHAPAVVELCMQAGAKVPKKYFCMMEFRGLTPNIVKERSCSSNQN